MTEGNYLLFDEMPWATVRTLLDQCWYVELDERLSGTSDWRRGTAGTADPPRKHTNGPIGTDERNAQLIAATAHSADAIVQLS